MNKFITFSLISACLIVFSAGLFFKNSAMLLGSASAFLCIGTTFITNIKTKLFPQKTYLIVILFISVALLGGKALNMYSLIPHFDKILHFVSGIIIGCIGSDISKANKIPAIISYVFIFSFGVALAGIWELFEFTMDSFFNMNCQNNSLSDTMFDMIAGTLGVVAFMTIKK